MERAKNSEDSDDGVATVSLSDSDWERLSYDDQDEGVVNTNENDLEAGLNGGKDDEDGVEPVRPWDAIETQDDTIGDEDSILTEEISENCDSGYPGDLVHQSATAGVLLNYIYTLHDLVVDRVTTSPLYKKYLEDNAMLASSLITATIVMGLPAIMAVFCVAGVVVCSAVACAVLGAICLLAGVVLTVIWSFWVSIPVFILLGSLTAGSTFYKRTFKIKMAAKDL